MSSSTSSPARFLRPSGVERIRRNQRRIHAARVLVLARNSVLAVALVAAAVWAWRQTQSDARFAVRAIEFTGAGHTPRASLDAVAKRYVGENLFKIDIARVQRDLDDLPWIERIAIEKRLPDTLRIRIVERRPVALSRAGDQLIYVDRTGLAFAPLTPEAGDDNLPIIIGAEGAELARTVAMLETLRRNDPAIYGRVSEVRPVAPRGFAVYDRDLDAFVFANSEDLVTKWRSLYAIVRAEGLGRGAVEYADLRFANRIVLKPLVDVMTSSGALLPQPPPQITN